jgi:hypothetical protein
MDLETETIDVHDQFLIPETVVVYVENKYDQGQQLRLRSIRAFRPKVHSTLLDNYSTCNI